MGASSCLCHGLQWIECGGIISRGTKRRKRWTRSVCLSTAVTSSSTWSLRTTSGARWRSCSGLCRSCGPPRNYPIPSTPPRWKWASWRPGSGKTSDLPWREFNKLNQYSYSDNYNSYPSSWNIGTCTSQIHFLHYVGESCFWTHLFKKKGVQLVCVHVVVWEGGGVEVEVLCSTCTQVTKRDFTSSVAHRRTFYESICFAELRNKVKK